MKLVVAAAIISAGRLLAAERSAPPELAGQWELPGGKVEEGEDPVDALRREIREELGVEIVVGQLLAGGLPGGDWPVLAGHVMRVWLCELALGEAEPQPLQDHARLAWVPLDQLSTVPWLAPDVPIAEAAAALAAELGYRATSAR